MEKFYFYYIRGLRNEPAVTVCVIKDEYVGVNGRGIAICSLKDQADKKVGREKALYRARKAIQSGRNSMDISADNTWLKARMVVPYRWKSEFNPKLNELERKLLA